MSYKEFELTQFLSDEKFQDWVLEGKNQEFWNTWIANNPQKKEEVDQAVSILRTIAFKKQDVPAEQVNQQWDQLARKIKQRKKRSLFADRPAIRSKNTRDNKRFGRQLLAIGLIATSLGLGLFYFLNSSTVTYKTYTTGYEEKIEVALGDGSTVKINANSKIQLPEKWSNSNRKVSVLYGEAYFKVNKLKTEPASEFTVLSDGLSISVLGTEFNVNSRRNVSTVALKEGSIRLNTDSGEKQYLEPGDVMRYYSEKDLLEAIKENQLFHFSWLQNSLLLDNIPLKEIAQLIEDHYGISVEIKREELQNRVLTGSVSDDDIQVIMKVIESTLGAKSTLTKDKIVIF